MLNATLPDLNHEFFVRQSIELAAESREAGNHPFGAVLVRTDSEILMENFNTFGEKGDSTGHAKRFLMTCASVMYPVEFLRGYTMYTSAEPCAMCAGSVYWSGVGRVMHRI